ncbi:MAG: prolipoprotein diacylglyceryl transferase [bacterium]|jgi:phosphatidylglycerol:prolipoprotein diacylglycerol transferase|nr:prolipoprotein diacylglyceryl transferase [Bacillota bacterium]HHW54502.1 prolipoprotein diacylglyceryl transferase [Bacillota bacterium]
MLLDLDPVLFRLGTLTVRWYGVMMALSMMIGYYYLLKHGKKLGLREEFLSNLALLVVFAGIVGARAIYVLTNWSYYAARPVEMVQIWRGGLSFHGGLLGGLVAGKIYLDRHGISWEAVADLVVPGLSAGYILVRIANIFNQEILGRPASLLPFARHPTQIYGSLIGVALLVLHNYLARRNPPPGFLFWAFIFSYSLLRGLVEETFRENPLYLWGYVNSEWGFGFFTLTQLITPALLLLAWVMMQRALARGKGGGATNSKQG